MKIYAWTVFLSAYLLFLVQPLIGKFIAPWFGATPSVWTTCLLFFQVFLLAGYAYAHLLSKLRPRRQVLVHAVLLVAAALLLPITPSEAWKPPDESNPTWRILVLLTVCVGGPYFILSSSSPLLQRWYASATSGRSPYRLYAVSNAGSLLALIAYPFAVEPILRLRMQTLDWSLFFGLFVLLSLVCLASFRKASVPPEAQEPKPERPAPISDRPLIFMWLGLAASGSIVLLATINQLGRDIPPVPFVFIVPLALYLITFIIAFDSPRWYSRVIHVALILPVGLAIGAMLFAQEGVRSPIFHIALYAFTLFACCMACHGELARLKPDPRQLTLYYLIIATGGALGGFFVAVVAPRVFDEVWEYPIGLILSFSLVLFIVARDLLGSRVSPGREHDGGPFSSKAQSSRSTKELRASRNRSRQPSPAREKQRRLGRITSVAGVIGVAGMTAFFWLNRGAVRHEVISQGRNFYGVIQVRAGQSLRDDVAPRGPVVVREYELYHGRTIHGFQFRHAVLKDWATGYYTRGSGIGLAIDYHPMRSVPDRQFRIGVIGLGVGTTAAYANERSYFLSNGKEVSDYIGFYEINPEVTRFAWKYFTYLEDAVDRNADVEVYPGDARLTMERQTREGERQHFDVLAVDAFSGDSIPMHLLTEECFGIYLAHLSQGGILAFHVSNKAVNLAPVVLGLANAYHMKAGLFSAPEDQGTATLASTWILVSNNEAFWSREEVSSLMSPAADFGRPILWTDDFSSLLPVIK